MLTHLQIENFKAWQSTGKLRLAPLTVIFGPNSSGKSSLGHFLLALKQTVLTTDRRTSFKIGDQRSLIDLGTFRDCLYGHDISNPLKFSMQWKLPTEMQVVNASNPSQRYTGDELALEVELIADDYEQPQTREFTYRLLKDGQTRLKIKHYRYRNYGKIESLPLQLELISKRKWHLDPPEKFYRISDNSLSHYKNAGFMAEFALAVEQLLENFHYLGPLREHPRRVYVWSGDVPSDVGANGEYTIAALLTARADGRKLNRAPGERRYPFDQFIAERLKYMEMIHTFKVVPLAEGRREYEVLIQVHKGSPEVKLTDVGFGISQVLPPLVQAFYAPPHSVIWMEQPEIHLHPSVQANLADVFISAIQAREDGKDRNVQLIVESHSEYFLTRLQRRVAEEKVPLQDVAIYFVQHGEAGARIEPLRLNQDGEIANWPENFFGDEMGEIVARTIAAMERKQRSMQR